MELIAQKKLQRQIEHENDESYVLNGLVYFPILDKELMNILNKFRKEELTKKGV